MSLWTTIFPRRPAASRPSPTCAPETSEESLARFVGEMAGKVCLQPDALHYRAWLNGAWARGLDVVLLPGVTDSFIIHIGHLVARVQDLGATPSRIRPCALAASPSSFRWTPPKGRFRCDTRLSRCHGSHSTTGTHPAPRTQGPG